MLRILELLEDLRYADELDRSHEDHYHGDHPVSHDTDDNGAEKEERSDDGHGHEGHDHSNDDYGDGEDHGNHQHDRALVRSEGGNRVSSWRMQREEEHSAVDGHDHDHAEGERSHEESDNMPLKKLLELLRRI